MAQVALLAALVAVILAAWSLRSLKSVQSRILALENPATVPLPARYSAPVEQIQTTFLPELDSDLDVVGAWAVEEERAGRTVSSEQIQVQRRMWLEA
jgi:hypothetical protein